MTDLNETNPAARAVLALRDRDVPAFIDQQIRRKTLSETVKSLNADVLSRQDESRRLARQALRKLGFI